MKKHFLIFIFLFVGNLIYGQENQIKENSPTKYGIKIDSIYDGTIFKGYMLVFDKNIESFIDYEKVNQLNPKWVKKIEVLINKNLHSDGQRKEFRILIYIKKKFKKQVKAIQKE